MGVGYAMVCSIVAIELVGSWVVGSVGGGLCLRRLVGIVLGCVL